MIDSRMLAFS